MMETRTKIYGLLVTLIIAAYDVNAQADIHFSQFYESSVLRNPALTGVFSNNYKISAYYRSQWSSITNPYQSMLLSAEYRLSLGSMSNDFLSFGLLGYNDQAGDLDQKITGVYPAINYNKLLSPDANSYLSVGVAAGYIQYSFDPSKATFNNQFVGGTFTATNPTFENIPNPKMALFDIGAGVNLNFSPGASNDATYMIGASGYHFTQPNFSYYHTAAYTQNIRWNVNAGMIRELSDNIMLQVHANYANQGSYNELIGGGLLGWHTFEALEEPSFEIYAGAFYRTSDAIAPVVKLRYKHLTTGISYDINTSTLKEASNMRGGLEITLSVSGIYPKNPGTYRKTVCPRF
jgi:type IX secretion system PorP/SprF family membrane protein